MKRKILSLLLAVGCSLTLSVAAVANDSDSAISDYVIVDGVSVPIEMILQQDAVNAYEKLCNSFEIDDNGNYIYPADYAGAYIDEDFNLVVMHTTRSISDYTNVLNQFDCIEYKIVKYSLNELNEVIQQELTNLSSYFEATSISYYVENKSNTAVIEVFGADNAAQAYSRIRNSANLPVRYEFVDVKSDFQTTLYGGDRMSTIPNSSYNGNFTAGICGTYNGNAAILTCGHLSADVGDPIYYGSTDTVIGTLALKNFYDGASGDYGIITLNSNATLSSSIRHESGQIPIKATMASMAEGTYCYKYGAKSGTSYLQVTVPYYHVQMSDISDDGSTIVQYNIRYLTKANIIDGQSREGDSGGPYYLYSGGRWVFCGMHSGYGQDETDYTSYCFFTPYRHVSSIFTVNLA